MNKLQLKDIRRQARPLYQKAGKYHGWDHIERVTQNALALASNYPETHRDILEAACYLHDIGRSKKGDHIKNGLKIAGEILEINRVKKDEKEQVLEAISNHQIENISKSKTIEAKLLFDADKIEIASVFGFVRVLLFLTEEEGMEMSQAINFLWKNVQIGYQKYFQTPEAKLLVAEDMLILRGLVERFNRWQNNPERPSQKT